MPSTLDIGSWVLLPNGRLTIIDINKQNEDSMPKYLFPDVKLFTFCYTPDDNQLHMVSPIAGTYKLRGLNIEGLFNALIDLFGSTDVKIAHEDKI